MNVILVSGFLGSGKTTIIREMASYMVRRKEFRVVILENEVGEVGIDDHFLSRDGFQVRGIFGGCICCQLTGEITKAVNGIAAEFSPDFVVIEATGLARPSGVLNVLKEYGRGIEGFAAVAVVDAGRWEELCDITPDLVFGQIAESDLVLVNKVDEQAEGVAREIIERAGELNPGAAVHALSALEGFEESLLEEIIASPRPGEPGKSDS